MNFESLCPGDLNVYEFMKGEANGLSKAD